MVDKDKIRKRTQDNDREKSSTDDSADSANSGAGVATDDNGDSGVDLDKKSKEEKMQEFKKGEGIVDEVDTGAGKVPRGDLEEILRAIANVYMFAEGKYRGTENPDGRREKNKRKAASAAFDEMSDLISRHEIQLLCDKYGISWKEDILRDELEKHTGESSRYEDKAGM